ncbi:hypothetical protein EON66_00920 [archaeon]|nr:MAG: hypothetical protein EON66_00920 [archaeon]
MRIAAWLTSHGGSAPAALALLKASGDVLRVEDILAFIPDTTLIDEFKTEINRSLDDCFRRIGDLRGQMQAFQVSAELVRNDIRGLRKRHVVVPVNSKCDLCSCGVLSDAFYVFPCGHTFHRACMSQEVRAHLPSALRSRADAASAELEALQEALQDMSARAALPRDARASLPSTAAGATPADVCAALARVIERASAEVDRLVARECILCGDIMIDSVGDGFADALLPDPSLLAISAPDAWPSSAHAGLRLREDDFS